MEKTFNIIPHAGIYESKGENAGDALCNFAFEMNGDMNAYFYADDNSNVICPYDVQEAITVVQDYAAKNELDLEDALTKIEIRGLKVSEIAEVINKINELTNKTKED